MAESEEFAALLKGFSGTARLFPLPNVVLFPHVVMPLHIFEPRYRAMLEYAMAHDRLIAMALLKPGWEADYENRPPIEPVVCLGRVLTHARQEDGRYNILLLGLSRARVLGELPPDRPFREARLELMPDVSPSAPASDPSAVHDELIALFRRFLAHEKSIRKQVEELLGKQASLGLLTDVVAFTLALDPSQKQRLLAEPNVDRRSRMLVRHLSERLKRKGPRRERGFPPEFSAN